MADLKTKLTQTDTNITGHPLKLQKSLELVLNPYLEEVGRSRIASDNLSQELRAAAIIDASIAQSGFRGIGAALSAIFKHQNLMLVVTMLVAISGFSGFAVAWKLGEFNRLLVDRNQKVILSCYKNWASDSHHSGWYTCPVWQLPMPEQHP